MPSSEPSAHRYPRSMRVLHWLRALLLLSLVALGWFMVSLPDVAEVKFTTLYPLHKQLGVMALFVALVASVARARSPRPAPPAGLASWDAALSRVTHRALLVLAVVVPLMGYAMSSSFSQSDGVPFLVFTLPELLPKNDAASKVFQWLHEVLAFALLGLAALHVAGALKHRLFDRGRETDVLRRML